MSKIEEFGKAAVYAQGIGRAKQISVLLEVAPEGVHIRMTAHDKQVSRLLAWKEIEQSVLGPFKILIVHMDAMVDQLDEAA